MKKKLLLAVILTFVLACIFALSVSAEVVISQNNLDENGDIVAELLVDLGDNYHICSVDITYTDVNGETKAGKFYYEISLWTQTNKRQIKTTYVPNDFDLSQIVYFCDKVDISGNGEYEYNEYIRLYQGGAAYRTYTYAAYENGEFSETVDIGKSLQAVSYSKYFEKLADRGFGSNAPMLKTVTYNGREAVEGTLLISPKIDDIFSGSFGGDGPSLTSNSIVPAFTRVVFEDRDISVSFGQYCFTRVAIEEIVFGKGTYYLNSHDRIALTFTANYPADATLKRVIVDNETVIGNGSISWNVGTYEVIFVGTEVEMEASYKTNCKDAFSCASRVYADPCYFGHTELEDDGDCTTAIACPVCLTYIYKEAMSHNNGEAIMYESYLEKGTYYVGCLNDGCTVGQTEAVDALVECIGYSVNTFGDTLSVVQGFVVNKSAVEAYREYNDTFELGVVAFGNTTGGAVTPSLGENKVVNCVLNLVNEYVDVRISGITEGMGENRVALCLYIIDDTGINFLNEGKTEKSVLGISYNEILNLK